MDIAKVFTTGRSQAVRLPRKYRFNTREVVVNQIDGMVVLYPREQGWELLSQSLERFSDDFVADRDQPPHPEERAGL